MNQRIVSVFFLLIFTLGCGTDMPGDKSSAPSSSSTAYIRRVEDGDTVLAVVGEQVVLVRLIGVDSPEMAGRHISKTQPYGPEAKIFLKKLIEKKWVKIKGKDKDKHDRLLATFYLGGEDVNLKMVAAGLAEVYPGFLRAEYKEAEDNARAQKLNLWQSPDRVSPRQWRDKYKYEPPH